MIQNQKINISYIAEINLNSKSAYKHQVLKMCDAFSQKGFKVKLFIINSNKIRFKKLKRDYLLKSNFKIIEIYNSINRLNFITRLFFSIKVFFLIKKKKKLFSVEVYLQVFFYQLFQLKIH